MGEMKPINLNNIFEMKQKNSKGEYEPYYPISLADAIVTRSGRTVEQVLSNLENNAGGDEIILGHRQPTGQSVGKWWFKTLSDVVANIAVRMHFQNVIVSDVAPNFAGEAMFWADTSCNTNTVQDYSDMYDNDGTITSFLGEFVLSTTEPQNRGVFWGQILKTL